MNAFTKYFMTALVAVGATTACSHKNRATQSATAAVPVATPEAKSNGSEFFKLLTEYTETVKHFDPFYATYFDVDDQLKEFGDYLSPQWKARYQKMVKGYLARTIAIDPKNLNEQERLNYFLLLDELQTENAGLRFPNYLLSVNPKQSRLVEFLHDSSPALSAFPFDSTKHYEDFLSRAKGLPQFVDNQIAALREGIKRKIVLNCDIAPKVRGSYQEALEKDPVKNPFYRPVAQFPNSIPSSDQQRLRDSYTAMVRETIIPSYEKFDQFFEKEYVPNCRKTLGYWAFPQGGQWYKQRVRASTTLELSPEKIHEIGLKEVARISKEMSEIQKQLGFKGNLKSFLQQMTNDPKTYFESRKEALQSYESVRNKVEEKIPKYFNLQPKTPYQILESENPHSAAGSYHSPTEMKPIGRFVVNTQNLRSNTRFETTTLFLHEAIPGHHFELALTFERKDRLTEYQRKIFSSNAFSEGWGLYAEYLGREMNLFEDPYQRLGHLSAEMLRAVRLVVDTGIHSKRWGFKQAFDYMNANLIADKDDIESEVRRYAVWPGQALGYKIGQLKILELRRQSEAKLGKKFDIKAFHDVVLSDGAVTLPLLEKKVHTWLAQTTGGPDARKPGSM